MMRRNLLMLGCAALFGAAIAAFTAPESSKATSGPGFAPIVKGISFGAGRTTQLGVSGTLLFRAESADLYAIDPMAIKQFAPYHCFGGHSGSPGHDFSLGELFALLEKHRPARAPRVVLQIERHTEDRTPYCAAIWFTYVDSK